MKLLKISSLLALCILLAAAVPCFAQTTAPAPTPAPAPAPAAPPTLSTVLAGLGINPSVDTFIRFEGKKPSAQSWDAGVGMNFVDYKQFLDARLEVTQGATGSPFVGIGPVLNLPAVVAKIKGVTWTTNFQAGVGLLGGYDTGTHHFAWGPVLGFGWTF